MKIALINPPLEDSLSSAKDRRKRAFLETGAPLGIAYIAAILEKNGYQVRMFDCVVRAPQSELTDFLKKEKPDIVGITAMSLAFGAAKMIAGNIRDILPRAVIVIGGPHVSALPGEVMHSGIFDIGVIGEGEITFLYLVRRIEESGLNDLEDIDGIAYVKDGETVLSKRRDFVDNLDDLPFPARHLLPPLSEYLPTPHAYKKLPWGIIITSRGCPMGCSFCDQAVFGSLYRARSADNILEELELMKSKFGAEEVRFNDDLFTLDNNRVIELCDKIRERNMVIPWSCFASVNTVSKELLKEMKSAGCWQVLYGLESGDEKVLKYLKKRITLADNERAVRWAKEAGLSVRALFVVGSPWETGGSLRNTLDFAKRSDIDYAHFIKFMPYPGSEAYKMLTKNGYRFDFSGGFSMIKDSDIMYLPDSLTREEFISFLSRARKEFYFRFSYVWRRIFSIKTWAELKAQIFGLFALFFRSKIWSNEEDIGK